MADFSAMTQALVCCDAAKLTTLVNDALAADTPAQEILNKLVYAEPGNKKAKDLLASLRCDCGDQLHLAMEMIGTASVAP